VSTRPTRFELRLSVAPADIDQLGHVNNVVYVRWIQEVAAAHWFAAAPPELVRDVVWVVLRHEIDYKRPAKQGDAIVATTWVGDATGTRFERFVEITRANDPALLAQARSVWCPLDAKTGRPRRIDPALHDYFYEPEAPPPP